MTREDRPPADTNQVLLAGGLGADHAEFPGRSPFTTGDPGWEAVIDSALAWARDRAASSTVVARPLPVVHRFSRVARSSPWPRSSDRDR